jgi:hypothetical protein
LRAVALASGFKRGEFIGDTNLSPIYFAAIIIIASLTRRSGHPISSWYQSQDQFVLGFLVQNMGRKVLIKMVGLRTSVAVWKAVMEMYASQY